MNANEVIASVANERLEGKRGGKSPVHPNDHVNLGQSSNDTFPTAMHIAAVREINDSLIPALRDLHEALAGQGCRLRRHRQDRPHSSPGRRSDVARPGVFRAMPRRSNSAIGRIEATLPGLGALAQGGTAVGTGFNTHPRICRAPRPASFCN